MDKKKISLKEIGLPKLILLFGVGVFLIILSFPNLFASKDSDTDKKNSSTNGDAVQQIATNATTYDTDTYTKTMEEKLTNILKKVSGIGDVEVMITLKSSKEQITLKDTPYTQESSNEDDGEGGSRVNSNNTREESTVLVTTDDGNIMPYIVQELEPEVEGVFVIAEGGDNVKIIMDIVETAGVLFDVPAHKVKVLKMSDGR